ncbi:hypothetical protein [Rothia sp. HMSC065G12]|nr:hypothetical protein [Rothia sp. HMSC065G12]
MRSYPTVNLYVFGLVLCSIDWEGSDTDVSVDALLGATLLDMGEGEI